MGKRQARCPLKERGGEEDGMKGMEQSPEGRQDRQDLEEEE